MAKQITRDRKLTTEEAAKYRKVREEIESEKPEIIAKAQQARREARRHQLADVAAGSLCELAGRGERRAERARCVRARRALPVAAAGGHDTRPAGAGSR